MGLVIWEKTRRVKRNDFVTIEAVSLKRSPTSTHNDSC